MKYLVVLVIFAFVQGVVIAADTTVAPSSTMSVLQEAISRAQVVLGNMTQEVSKVLGIKDITDGEKILNTILSGTQNLVARVTSIVTDLQNQVSTNAGDISGILRSVTDRLNATLQDLQIPEMQAKAAEVQHQLENGLQSLISVSRQLANAALSNLSNAQSDIATITNNALEEVINTASKVQEKVKAAVTSAAPSV